MENIQSINEIGLNENLGACGIYLDKVSARKLIKTLQSNYKQIGFKGYTHEDYTSEMVKVKLYFEKHKEYAFMQFIVDNDLI